MNNIEACEQQTQDFMWKKTESLGWVQAPVRFSLGNKAE